MDECRASIRQHSKSFSLASQLLPPDCRDDAAVVYAFCRRADDAIDLTSGSDQRVALERLKRELEDVYADEPLHDPVLSRFREVARRRGLPRLYPEELLAGMEMDAKGYEYRSWDDLLEYAYRVASTVGLMMCHVMGVRHPDALRHAAHLGMAMQLTNVCRDVFEDWQIGRLYLPDDLLKRHGAPGLRDALGGVLPDAGRTACRGALRETLQLAERYYASGDRGLKFLSPRCALGVDVARRVYSSIGEVLSQNDYDVLAPRAVVSLPHKLSLCTGALLTGGRRWLHHGRGALRRESLPRIHYGSELLTP